MKMILIDETLTPLFFYVYPANVHENRIYPLILEMLKRRKLIRFGDAIIMEGFYAYKNYLIGIRYGTIPLIIPKKNFRFERLKGLISYPLFVFNSKNVEKERKRYRKLVRKLFEGLKLNLKSLRYSRGRNKTGKRSFQFEEIALLCFRTSKKEMFYFCPSHRDNSLYGIQGKEGYSEII